MGEKPHLSRRTLLALGIGSVTSLAGCSALLGRPEPPECSGNQTTGLSAPAVGPADAPVTVAIYTDFDCPHCKTFFQETFPTVRNRVPTATARFVHHDFPIPVSKWSYPVASAARAVQETNSVPAFWAFADRAYRHQSEYSFEVIERLAKQTKSDTKTVRRAAKQLPYCRLLKREREQGANRGVEGTPTVFVNDQLLQAPDADELADAITDKS